MQENNHDLAQLRAKYGKNPNDRKYSPTGNPLTAFVNLHQTTEERRDKYVFCREAGLDAGWSRAMRDWRWTSIFEYIDTLVKYPITTAITAFNP